jgi:CRP/FNR family transcriptional regulator, cyclic AMP receptor protein
VQPVLVPQPLDPESLSSIGIFGALPPEVLARLGSLEQLEVAVGDVCFREGDTAREMYVVLQGELEVTKKSRSGHEGRVALLGMHDWFGEMGLVDIHARSATVRALAPARLLRIGAEDLDALYRQDVKAYALFVLNLCRELSRRLRVADGIMADLIDHSTAWATRGR